MKSLMKIITKRPKLQKIEAKCLKCDLNSFKDVFDFNEHVRLCYGKELNQGKVIHSGVLTTVRVRGTKELRVPWTTSSSNKFSLFQLEKNVGHLWFPFSKYCFGKVIYKKTCIVLPCKKCVTEKTAYVNKGCNLLNSYLIMGLLSIPFNKLL